MEAARVAAGLVARRWPLPLARLTGVRALP